MPDQQAVIDIGLEIGNQSIISNYNDREALQPISTTPLNNARTTQHQMNASIASQARNTFIEKQLQK